ncbi:transglycosylase SLT domain-containing protein [Necropsobacter massiliensis]|uniref:transglycosylase SLT domain-containing protein n=1 Tax=Necropsobacter massiliensis TaxID=1400001 RepID=UPI000693C8B6|nr:transglycosylase SLT domain-containing protein [Necropsobacter massiliensis]
MHAKRLLLGLLFSSSACVSLAAYNQSATVTVQNPTAQVSSEQISAASASQQARDPNSTAQKISALEQAIQRLQKVQQTQQRLARQRADYQRLSQMLSASSSENTRRIARDLLAGLTDYPLYPYAAYQLLNANQDNITLAEILAFHQQNPNFSVTELSTNWLQQQQKNRNWREILNNAESLPSDQRSRCIVIQARQEIAKTDKKQTALSAQDLTQLWLTGNSLPRQCDPLLEQWSKTGGITPELVKQRALLAFEKNNGNLITHLERQAADDTLKKWLADLNQLLNAPQNLHNPQNTFYIDKLSPHNAEHKRLLLTIVPAFINKLTETELSATAPFAVFAEWAERFALTPAQTAQWKKRLLGRIFDTDDVKLQQWRDSALLNLKDDGLLERRIRLAIRQQSEIAPWLQALSDKAAAKDEWRYWSAKVLQKQGKNVQARAILQAMQKDAAGFYPMLAAEELGIDYQPQMKAPTATQTQTEVAQQYAEPLTRIQELRKVNDTANSNREWRQLLERADFEQKLQLAEYAGQQQWYDLQVEATIRAKAWEFIPLRLPNAYQDWFDLFLKDKKIDRTFAMAISRQESAWRPDVSSSADARGLMQLLPATAKLTAQKFRLPYSNDKQLFDPFINIMLGTAHLQELYDRYGNNRILIAAAYNAGARRVDSWLEKSASKLSMAEFIASIPFYETRGYVQNVLTYAYYYQLLQNRPIQKFTQQEYNRLY